MQETTPHTIPTAANGLRSSSDTSAHPILDSVLQSISAAPLQLSPFTHIRLENVFPVDYYREILQNLPAIELYGEQKHKDAMRADGTSTRLRFELERDEIARLPELQRAFWSDFLDQFEGEELGLALRRKFQAALRARFGRDPDAIDVQQRLVLFKDIPGYRISVHADNADKVVTTQFYLPRDAAQTHLGTSFHEGPSKSDTHKVAQLPFLPNSGYSFPVTQSSWHSVEPVTEADGARNTLMAIYYQRSGVQKLKTSLRRMLSPKRR